MSRGKVLAKNPRVITRAKDEELILLNTETAEVTMLNFEAAFIWSLIDGVRELDDIVDIVHKKFPDTTTSQIKQDVLKIGEKLAAKGFILRNHP